MMFTAGIRSESAVRTVKRIGRATLSATPLVAAILVGGVAQAQQAAAPAAPEEVVVSGSRIQHDGYSSPTPTAVVNEEVLKANATSNLADTLNTMPNFVGSATPQTSAITVTSGQQAVNGLNLGGLGQTRTLVLLNGQRTVGSTLTGVVDVTELPQQLIKRVDVVTGGASASYGSDALTGIVNFVLDTHFNGVKGDISAGETTYGDDRNAKISLTAGTNFMNGRGHVELSGEAVYDPGVMVAHRPWNNNGYGIITNPNYKAGNGQPQYLMSNNIGVDTISYGGTISGCSINGGASSTTLCPFRGVMFGPGGAVTRETFGGISGGVSDPLMAGGSWANQTVTNVAGAAMQPVNRHQNIFTRADFELTDNIAIYAQGSYSQLYSYSSSVPVFNPSQNVTIQATNPFIPISLAQQLQAGGVTSFQEGSFLGDLGGGGTLGVQHPTTGRQVARYAMGATGDFDLFGKNYTWDADATYGWSTQNVTNPGTIFIPNYNTAVQARLVNGQIVCGAPVANSTAGCVPWNNFGLGVNSQAAINYVQGAGLYPWQDARLHQAVQSANLKGSPFDNWAGPVQFAIGVEHREEATHSSADAQETLPSNWSLGIGPGWSGSFHVAEGYIETDVPLLKDLPFAQSANINAAFREAGYSAFGLVHTWKVGGTYSPGYGLTLRATRSADLREPTLVDLYSAGTQTTNSLNDPFNGNATTLYISKTVGNPNVQPEMANNLVLGGVYQPTFIPRLNTSIDYYNINITHAILTGGLSEQNILNYCFNGNTQICSLFSRVGSGPTASLLINKSPLNLASEHQNRMEFNGAYLLPLDLFKVSWLQGDMNFTTNITHFMNYTTNSGIPGAVPTYVAGANNGSMPKWKWSATVSYDLDPVSVSLTGRGFSSGTYNNNWVACTAACPVSTANYPTYTTNHLDGAFYLDLGASYHFNVENTKDEVYFNVRNLLNTDPVLVAQGGSTGYDFFPANQGLYDILGRVMRVGVRFQM